jgi:hypothetical protein
LWHHIAKQNSDARSSLCCIRVVNDADEVRLNSDEEMEGEGVAEATCAAEGVHGPRKRKNNSSRNIFVFATSDSILNTRLMDPACQDDRMDLSASSQIVDADFLPRNALATARIRTIDIFCLCKGAHSISQSTF